MRGDCVNAVRQAGIGIRRGRLHVDKSRVYRFGRGGSGHAKVVGRISGGRCCGLWMFDRIEEGRGHRGYVFLKASVTRIAQLGVMADGSLLLKLVAFVGAVFDPSAPRHRTCLFVDFVQIAHPALTAQTSEVFRSVLHLLGDHVRRQPAHPPPILRLLFELLRQEARVHRERIERRQRRRDLARPR